MLCYFPTAFAVSPNVYPRITCFYALARILFVGETTPPRRVWNHDVVGAVRANRRAFFCLTGYESLPFA